MESPINLGPEKKEPLLIDKLYVTYQGLVVEYEGKVNRLCELANDSGSNAAVFRAAAAEASAIAEKLTEVRRMIKILLNKPSGIAAIQDTETIEQTEPIRPAALDSEPSNDIEA